MTHDTVIAGGEVASGGADFFCASVRRSAGEADHMVPSDSLVTACLVAALAFGCAMNPGPSDEEPAPWSARAAPSLTWRALDEGGATALAANGNTLFVLRHGATEDEPALHPLGLPGGAPLTRDRPTDHSWHHGLWFAWKFVDGVDYWEHGPEGRPVGRTRWAPPELEIASDDIARASMELTYGHAEGGTGPERVRLEEHRELVVHPPGPDGTWGLDWTSTFTATSLAVTLDRTPLPGEPGGKVFGGYGGLSLRLAQLEERTVNSEFGPVVFSPEHRARPRALALDYAGRPGPDGTDASAAETAELAGIAVLESPSNPRLAEGGRTWYAIRSGAMTFFTPAVLTEGPLVVEPGQPLHLGWRILVHPGAWDAARLRLAAERFANGQLPGR